MLLMPHLVAGEAGEGKQNFKKSMSSSAHNFLSSSLLFVQSYSLMQVCVRPSSTHARGSDVVDRRAEFLLERVLTVPKQRWDIVNVKG